MIHHTHFIRGQFVVNCTCNLPSHMLHFYYDEENKELTITTVLSTEKNIFKRIWIAIRYIFGYNKWMCEFQDTLLPMNKIEELQKLLKQAMNPDEYYEN